MSTDNDGGADYQRHEVDLDYQRRRVDLLRTYGFTGVADEMEAMIEEIYRLRNRLRSD